MTDWPTTRRYPRTFAEAFPRSIEMAAAVEVERVGPVGWLLRAIRSALRG